MDIILRLVSDSAEPADFFGGDLEYTQLATGQWYIEGGSDEIEQLISSLRKADQIEGNIIVCSNVQVMI